MEGFLKLSTAANITVLLIDSADHLTGKTGLAAGLTIYATKAAGTPAVITPTVTELDATNVKGLYKLALTTAHTDTLGEFQLHITATGADPADLKWQVSTYLPGEAVTLQADQGVNVTKFNGTTVTARDIGASVLLSAGTGAGQLDFTSGVVKSNQVQVDGTVNATHAAGMNPADVRDIVGVAVSATTAQLGVNVVNYNNVAAQTDANNLPKVDVEDWKAGVVPATNVTGEPLVDVNHWRGTQPNVLNNNLVQTDVERWLNGVVATPITTGVPVVDWTPSPAELTGTATASGANTITLASAASTTAQFYNGMVILITSGVGKGQARIILDYSAGRVATVSPAWTTIPASNATYVLLPVGIADLETLLASNSTQGAAVTSSGGGGRPDVHVVQWDGGFVAFDGGTGLPNVRTVNNGDKTGYALTAAYDPSKTASQAGDAMALTAGERNSTADALLARSIGAESYAAKGAVPTLRQALFMLLQEIQERSIVATTLTVKKLDGTTTAMTFTLDSATTPTSRTRTT